ncbi:MAG: hypothetical protein Q8S41_05905 [Lutibacter sp.]|nr:hypothetical protein [Lutibacter sp.]
MTKNTLPVSNDNEQDQLLLKAKINLLQKELNDIEQKTNAFEAILRSHLIDELIEEQELTVLYKKVQLAKKERRFAQKKKGKNFKDLEGLKVIVKNNANNTSEDNQKKKNACIGKRCFLCIPINFRCTTKKLTLLQK